MSLLYDPCVNMAGLTHFSLKWQMAKKSAKTRIGSLLAASNTASSVCQFTHASSVQYIGPFIETLVPELVYNT